MQTATAGNWLAQQRVRDALIDAAERLATAGIDSARLDAEVLLAHALEISRENLLAAWDVPLTQKQVTIFESLLLRRLEREPIFYITGSREFWSLDFQVSRAVLIPRPETERLIEVVLGLVAKTSLARTLQLADLGTGSGAIAITLATELPAARLVATDIAPTALALARRNAWFHDVARRIDFLSGDLFEPISGLAERFDVIVSNPPYIESELIATLEPEVRDWEPRGALDGGADGLDFYRRIAAQAYEFLAPDGAIALEIGADAGRQVHSLFADAGRYRDILIYQDHAGRDRVVVAVNAARA